MTLLAPWRPAERRAWEPSRLEPIEEWAHRRFLLAERSAEPGPVDLDRNPWCRGILRAWADPRIRKLTIQKSVQSGVTTLAEMMVAWRIDQDPTDIMWAVPTKEDVHHYQTQRFRPMVDRNAAVVRHATGIYRDTTKRQFVFDRCAVWFRHASSKKDLASDPCGAVVGDELDKWTRWTEDEGDPVKLLEDRTTTFRRRKILLLSTPSTKQNHIHRSFQAGDQRRYRVPCPECGEYQPLEFTQVKCPPSAKHEPRRIRSESLAYYECVKCKAQIADTQANKDAMLRAGVWVQEGARVDKAGRMHGAYPSDHASFHISMLYVPNAWRSWSDVLSRFLEVREDPAQLQVFVNQWLGEVWEEKAARTTVERIQSCELDYAQGTVPDGVGLIVAGVDVQKDHFWFTVRGFGLELRSWLIESGRIETWEELERRLIWGTWSGYHASLVAIDAGDGNRMFEVLEFCARFMDVARPTKGMSRDTGIPVRTSSISRHWKTGRTLPNDLTLWQVNTKLFKDRLARLIRPEKGEPRRWHVHHETSDAYRAQMASEHKVWVQKKRGDGGEWRWTLRRAGADNHLWDAEVLCLFAAHIVGAESLREEDLLNLRAAAGQQRQREHVEEQRREIDRRREGRGEDFLGDMSDYWS